MRANAVIRLTAVATVTATLAACGGVQIKPETALPKPLIVTMPAHVGLVIPSDTRNYTHSETRWGVDWTVQPSRITAVGSADLPWTSRATTRRS